MKDYIISAVYAAIFAGIILLLSPKGKGGGIESHVKLLVSLAFISVMIQPAVSFFKTVTLPDFKINIDTTYAYEEKMYDDLLKLEKSELETRLKALISNKFSIKEENIAVTVTVSVENDAPRTEKVFVKLSGAGILRNTNEIEDYVSDLLSCPCSCFV